jgi:cell division septation protein DedD
MLPSAADSAPIRTETVELTPREPDSRSGAADSESDQAESAPAQVAVVVSGAPEAGREQGVADDAPSAASAATASPRTAERASGSPTAANADATTQLANGWWVQLGAFGEAANAAQLVSRVATYGYTARVFELTSGGRVMHRVRVGAFASENEAEAAASALSAHNFTVDVIRPE